MVSVVIRTLNESRHLGELLACIRAQELDQGDVEIVVVDSGSSDKTLDIAAEFGCQIVHIQKQDFTFGRSLNQGCAAAKGDILAFVSGHCAPRGRRWLTHLIAPIVSGDVQYSYGRQTGRDTTKFSEQQVFEKYFPAAGPTRPAGIFCNNANAALLRNVWDKIRFDENLTGLEDMMFAKELQSRGGQIGYAAEAVVYHIHDETWRQVRLRYERESLALRAVMPEMHFGVIDFVRYFVGGVFHDWRIALRLGLLRENFLEILLFRFMQFSGTYLGNREHRRVSARRKEEYFYPKVMRTPLDENGTDRTAAGQGAQRTGSK